jgi:hypothetical protein
LKQKTYNGTFSHSGRAYEWQYLPSYKDGESDALVYGPDLFQFRGRKVLVFKDDWEYPTGDKPTPLGRAAINSLNQAIELSEQVP